MDAPEGRFPVAMARHRGEDDLAAGELEADFRDDDLELHGRDEGVRAARGEDVPSEPVRDADWGEREREGNGHPRLDGTDGPRHGRPGVLRGDESESRGDYGGAREAGEGRGRGALPGRAGDDCERPGVPEAVPEADDGALQIGRAHV